MRLRHLVTIGPRPPIGTELHPDADVTFVPMEAIADGLGGLDISQTRPFSEVVSGSYNYFAEGDLLLAKVTPCFENGKKALAQSLSNGIGYATSEVHVIRPGVDRIHPKYLFYLLCSEDFRAGGIASMTGAGGLRRVSDAAVLNYQPSVTNLPTQKAIADFLDRETARIDQLIEKKRRMVEVLGEKRAATITRSVCGDHRSECLEGRDRGAAEGGIRVTKYQLPPLLPLKRLAAIHSSNVDKVIENDEIPIRLCNYVDVYHNDQIHPALEFSSGSAKQSEIDRFGLRPGDVLITKDSETPNDIAVPALGDSKHR